MFDFSKQALSKHIAILEDAGVIARHKRGRTHEIRLEAKTLDATSRWIDERRRVWDANLDRLGAVLEQDP